MTTYLQNILTYFRNLTLNSLGVKRDLYRLLQDHDIDHALHLMTDRDLAYIIHSSGKIAQKKNAPLAYLQEKH